MTILSVKKFSGEIPRSPPHLLPDNNAVLAVNCNFAYGELRPMKAGFELGTLAVAARSLFTLDGINFYAWATKTRAWKGPVIGDIYNRMYYSNATDGFRVAYTTGMQPLGTAMTPRGGPPATSYKVGVPRPTSLSYTLTDLTALPDYPSASVRIYSYYESDGRQYEETQVTTFTTVTAFKRYYVASVAAPTTPAASTASTSLASFTYADPAGEGTSYQTVSVNGASVTINNASSLTYNGTTYNDVNSVTPVNANTTTLGAILQDNAVIAGNTPAASVVGFKLELFDQSKNTVIASMSATVGNTSTRSDGVPGGVDIKVYKSNAGGYNIELSYGVIETRAYVATVINQNNEESQPCDAIFASPTYMQSVTLTLTPSTASGYIPQTLVRFYRAVNGTYISVTPAPVALTLPTTTYNDSLINIVDTDATLATAAWGTPPENLKGLTLLANGFFAGFVGDTVYFSEPYAPWAWPYSMSFPFPVVGLRAVENGLVVTTNSYPYIVSGVHPASMTQTNLSHSQAGVSDVSMAVVGGSVAYAGNDGIVMVTGGNVDVETFQKYYTREVWRSRYGSELSTMEMSYYDGGFVVASPNPSKSFEIRLDEATGAYTQLATDFYAGALYLLPATDQLYYVAGSTVYQYKGGSDAQYTWQSREWLAAKPISLTAGFINIASGSVNISVYGDGVLLGSGKTMNSTGYFRLPSGKKYRSWSIRLVGNAVVREVSLGSSIEELRSV